MKIGDSVFEVVNKDGKLFVKHTFNGENYQEVKYINGCFSPLYSNARENTEVIGNIHDEQ